MLRFPTRIKEEAKKRKSIVSLGLDPVIEDIPLEVGSEKEQIIRFYRNILEEINRMVINPGVVKPNYAFYAQYGMEGIEALKEVMKAYKDFGFMNILDAKRGDIGKTSGAYAKEVFNFFEADAVTVAPYMGVDSVEPFFEYCDQGKGVYVLVRTSNPGGKDFQDLVCDGEPLYLKVADKVIDWAKKYEGVGMVLGATYLEELEKVVQMIMEARVEMPLLIPGVGKQGGSAKEVADALKRVGYELGLVRINSSSGINYAYKETGGNYAEAAVEALRQLNEEIGYE